MIFSGSAGVSFSANILNTCVPIKISIMNQTSAMLFDLCLFIDNSVLLS